MAANSVRKPQSSYPITRAILTTPYGPCAVPTQNSIAGYALPSLARLSHTHFQSVYIPPSLGHLAAFVLTDSSSSSKIPQYSSGHHLISPTTMATVLVSPPSQTIIMHRTLATQQLPSTGTQTHFRHLEKVSTALRHKSWKKRHYTIQTDSYAITCWRVHTSLNLTQISL